MLRVRPLLNILLLVEKFLTMMGKLNTRHLIKAKLLLAFGDHWNICSSKQLLKQYSITQPGVVPKLE